MSKLLLFILGLIVVILGPDFWSLSGSYFFLDTAFVPVYTFQNFFSQSLYWHLEDMMIYLLGYEIYSRVFFLMVLGVGAYLGVQIGRLINQLLHITSQKIQALNLYLGVVFVLMNPFIYERMVTQTGIAFGMFFLGLGLVETLFFLQDKQRKQIYLTAIFWGISITIFPHAIILLILLALCFFPLFWKTFGYKNIGIIAGIIGILNINWILGTLFFKNNETLASVTSFDTANIESFVGNSLGGLGVELTHLQLYGFWGERYGHLLTPDIFNPSWYISGVIILGIIFLGIIYLYKKQRTLALFLMSVTLISYTLALGIASGISRDISLFLYAYIPGYIGMREPEKFLGIVMLCYALFFLSGVSYIAELIQKKKEKIFLHPTLLHPLNLFVLCFLFLTAWSPAVLFGYAGQMKIYDYPPEYFEAREFLQETAPKSKSLVLPWHSYMGCSWTEGKIIHNPIQDLFSPLETTIADNIEVGFLYTNSSDTNSQKIEQFLQHKQYGVLGEMGYTHIIFTKFCADFLKYDFLSEDSHLKTIFASENIDIYNITYE